MCFIVCFIDIGFCIFDVEELVGSGMMMLGVAGGHLRPFSQGSGVDRVFNKTHRNMILHKPWEHELLIFFDDCLRTINILFVFNR